MEDIRIKETTAKENKYKHKNKKKSGQKVTLLQKNLKITSTGEMLRYREIGEG